MKKYNDGLNIYFNPKGEIKRCGYKSLAGLIQLLKRVNKNCIKFGARVRLEIEFPMKEGFRKPKKRNKK